MLAVNLWVEDKSAEVFGPAIVQSVPPRPSFFLLAILQPVTALHLSAQRRLELGSPSDLHRKSWRTFPQPPAEIERHRRPGITIPSDLTLSESPGSRHVGLNALVDLDIDQEGNHTAARAMA
jgi:hypothetical protein